MITENVFRSFCVQSSFYFPIYFVTCVAGLKFASRFLPDLSLYEHVCDTISRRKVATSVQKQTQQAKSIFGPCHTKHCGVSIDPCNQQTVTFSRSKIHHLQDKQENPARRGFLHFHFFFEFELAHAFRLPSTGRSVRDMRVRDSQAMAGIVCSVGARRPPERLQVDINNRGGTQIGIDPAFRGSLSGAFCISCSGSCGGQE